MIKESLYYKDPYLRTFRARVIACEEKEKGYEIRLDQSAFYPEGGGQAGDTGRLNDVVVLDCYEREGEIIHLCAGALSLGAEVEGTVDFARRFDLMQQHSGEHMVSGIVHVEFGYNNVGFHMGAAVTAIDFDGELSWEQVKSIEGKANAVIWQNLPIQISWPGEEELAELPYRSKKELSGDVRIVTIPGVDLCACCGTHVKSTGEVGLVKLLSVQKLRSGCRLELVCGQRAYDYVCAVGEQNRAISQSLSAKPLETHAAVLRMQEELERVKYRLVGMEELCFAQKAEELEDVGDVLLLEEGLSPDGLRRLCDAVMRRCGGRCAVFSGDDEAGYRYAVGHAGEDVRAFIKAMNAALSGRGGGKDGFAQGSVAAKAREIEDFFQRSAEIGIEK